MRISAKGRYGLRALFDLALNDGQGPILIREIAKRQAIPEAYLEQIFLSLKAAGLVKSVRGVYGGYLLNQESGKISIEQILEALEKVEEIVPCLDNPKVCSLFKDCVLKDFWKELGDSQKRILSGTSLAELVKKKQERQQEQEPPVYQI